MVAIEASIGAQVRVGHIEEYIPGARMKWIAVLGIATVIVW